MIELVSGMLAPQFREKSSSVLGSELVQGSRFKVQAVPVLLFD
jgi:hypothetical protein